MQLELAHVATHARLRCRDVIALMRISRSTLYTLLKTVPDFPRPVRFRRTNRWVAGEILRYMQEQEARRDA